MDATTVSGVLLELNVINTPELDAQFNKLASQINDERAAKWFRRVPRYFVINLDAQRDTPLKVKPEPRGHYGSSAYVDPSNPQGDTALPLADIEDEPKWAEIDALAARTAKSISDYGAPSRQDSEEAESAMHWIADYLRSNRPVADTDDTNAETGVQKAARGYFNELVARHADKADSVYGSYRASSRKEREAWKDLNTATRDKRIAKQISQNESADDIVNRLLEADYETMLHKPLVQRDIENNFAPFKPAKAKAKRLHGEPPTKSELPDWMKNSADKELYHFDPIQVQRRALWDDLKGLVLYLNWQHSNLKLAKSEDKEEAAKARSAEMLFRRLATMKTEDIDGFRDIMGQAKDFKHKAAKEPWRFTQEGRVLAKNGPYTLMRVTNPELVMALSSRKTGDSETPVPEWCVKSLSHVNNYGRLGPYYFIDRNGLPHILAHFQSGQVRGLDNLDFNPSEARDIGQLFKKVNVDTQLTGGYTGGAGYRNLVSAIVDAKKY